jgi:hypothetical protein
MTASGIGLEGHRGNLWSEAEQAFTLYSPDYQLAHPCNNADVWSCAKDMPERSKNTGSTVAIMRIIDLLPA